MKVFKNLNATSSAAKSFLGHSHSYFQQRFHILFKSRRSQMLFNIGFLKNFGAFTGKHLRWSLFLIMLQVLILLRMGLFRAAHRWRAGGQKASPAPVHILQLWNLTQLQLLKEDLKNINESRDTFLEFCWHQHFPTKNQRILLYQEIQI